MHCKRCHAVMERTRREVNPNSQLEWYACPICQRMEFVAEPWCEDSRRQYADLPLAALKLGGSY